MRIGYFGGTFDPIHHGHLALAEACREHANLDRVVLVVSGRPPHKPDRRLSPGEHRLAMTRLACEGNPALFVDGRELTRPGPSYTIDTVRSLLLDLDPSHEPLWLIGADTLPDLPSWHRAADLLDLIEIVTASRPGHDASRTLTALRDVFGSKRVERLRSGLVPMPLLDISSSDLRRRIRAGASTRYLLPEAVRRYIRRQPLYT